MKEQVIEKKPIPNKELRQYIKSFSRDKRFKQNDVTYYKILKDKLLISTAVRHGVTNQLFDEITANSPFDDKQWSSFLYLNIRTLQRYKVAKDHVFKPFISEKIFELAEVIALGNIVFDSPDDFRIWLLTPSISLGKEKPISLLDNSYGMELVIAELNRIEHGVFV